MNICSSPISCLALSERYVMITWRAWSKYAIVSFPYVQKEIDRVIRQKGYSISKAIVEGEVIYECWKLPDIHMGKFKGVDEAKNYVEGLVKLESK